MAEKLKRDYDIIVLKTELRDLASGGAEVSFTLQYKVNGKLTDARVWTMAPEAIGIAGLADMRSMRGAPPPAFQLSAEMLEPLAEWFREDVVPGTPLWVHLVQPYGALRLVPWERLLGPPLDVPVLMLPDFLFPPPLETEEELDILVCGSAPLGYEQWSVTDALRQSVQRLVSATGRRTRLHVFTDADIVAQLRAGWAADPMLGDVVRIYDTATAAAYVEEDVSSRLVDRAQTLRSPWLLWMRDQLSGRAIDVAHFVNHGYLTRGRGALLFAQSPLERTDRFLAGPVGALELQTFLTAIGAWATTFISLPDNNSEPGLRALVDDVAQSRPGPLLMDGMGDDPTCAALADGYRFLFGREPSPVPRTPALYICCQPYLVSPAARDRASRRPAGVPAVAPAALPEAARAIAPPVAPPSAPPSDPPIAAAPPPKAPPSRRPAAPPSGGSSGSSSKERAMKRPPPRRPKRVRDLDAVGSPPAVQVTGAPPPVSVPMAEEPRVAEPSPLEQTYVGRASVESWVASTERFAEQVQLRYRQLERDEIASVSQCAHDASIAMDTVDRLRRFVAGHALTTRKDRG